MTTIHCRLLTTLEEYQACIPLQRATWGRDFNEIIPAAMLKIANEMGGVVAGAFTEDNRMAGFVFGVTGLRHGKLAHWSDMLAVYDEFRGQGIGQTLKRFQRDQLLLRGIRTMYWTYDPLEAQNANLNWNLLGVTLEQYVPDMYGNTVSPLHSGLPTDRMLVEWQMDTPDVIGILEGRPRYTEADFAGATILTLDSPLVDADQILLEIPTNIQAVKKSSIDEALQWRMYLRHAFQHYCAYPTVPMTPVTFLRHTNGRFYYALTRKNS